MKHLSIQTSMLILAALAGCDQLETAPLAGIVHTDTQGVIIEDDPGDWQPRCGEAIGSCITPLSPNPVELGGSTSLRFTLADDAFVSIRIEDEQGNMLDEFKGRRLEAGTNTLGLSPQARRGYKEGVYRLEVLAYDSRGRRLFGTYGDLSVERPHNNTFSQVSGGVLHTNKR